MKLTSDRELANTQKKLRLLEEQYQEAQSDPNESEELAKSPFFRLNN